LWVVQFATHPYFGNHFLTWLGLQFTACDIH